MRRISLVCICVLGLVFGGGQVAAASTQTSTKGSSAAAAPLDLATMVLVPADLPAKDAVVFSGARYFLDSYSGRKAIALRAAGYNGGFESWLGPEGNDREYQVAAALDEFKTVKGAMDGYEAFLGSAPNVGTTTIGEESWLGAHQGADPYDNTRPDNGLILAFRINRIVATVYVDNFTAKKPSVAAAERLGTTLAARIKHTLARRPAEPGLSNRALRLNVPVESMYQDAYYRLAGRDRIGAYDANLPRGAQSFDTYYHGATDIYVSGQHVNDRPDTPSYALRMATFPKTYDAAKWVKTYLAINGKGPDGWRAIKERQGAKTFGDQSHVATYHYPAAKVDPGPTIYGTVIVARYGSVGVAVRIQAYQPVPVALVEALMTAQAKCLTSSALCPRTKVPAGLNDLTAFAAPASAPPPDALMASQVAGSEPRIWGRAQEHQCGA